MADLRIRLVIEKAAFHDVGAAVAASKPEIARAVKSSVSAAPAEPMPSARPETPTDATGKYFVWARRSQERLLARQAIEDEKAWLAGRARDTEETHARAIVENIARDNRARREAQRMASAEQLRDRKQSDRLIEQQEQEAQERRQRMREQAARIAESVDPRAAYVRGVREVNQYLISGDLTREQHRMAVKKLADKFREATKPMEDAGKAMGESLGMGILASIGEGSPFMLKLPLMMARGLSRVAIATGPLLPAIGGAAVVAGLGIGAYREYQKYISVMGNEGLLGAMGGTAGMADAIVRGGIAPGQGTPYAWLGISGFVTRWRERMFAEQAAVALGQVIPGRGDDAMRVAGLFANMASTRKIPVESLQKEAEGFLAGVDPADRTNLLKEYLELQSSWFAKSRPSDRAMREASMELTDKAERSRLIYSLRQRTAQSFQMGLEAETELRAVKKQAAHQKEISDTRSAMHRSQIFAELETDPGRRFELIQNMDNQQRLLALRGVAQTQEQLQLAYDDSKQRWKKVNDRYEAAYNEWVKGREGEGKEQTLRNRFAREAGAGLAAIRQEELRRMQEAAKNLQAFEAAQPEAEAAIEEQFRQLRGRRGTERTAYASVIGARQSAAEAARRARLLSFPGMSRLGGMMEALHELGEQQRFAGLRDDTALARLLGTEREGLAAETLYEMGATGFTTSGMARRARLARRQVERGLRRFNIMREDEAYSRSHAGRVWFNDPDVAESRRQAMRGEGEGTAGSAADRMLEAANIMLRAATMRATPPNMTATIGGRSKEPVAAASAP